MRIKISKVAKDLNVGVNTVVEFLRKQGIDVENNPNARIDDAAEKMLKSEFSSDRDDKKRVEDFTNGRQKPRRGSDRFESAAGGSIPQAPGLKVLGKIDLDAQRRGGSRHGGNQSKQSRQGSSSGSKFSGERNQSKEEKRQEKPRQEKPDHQKPELKNQA